MNLTAFKNAPYNKRNQAGINVKLPSASNLTDHFALHLFHICPAFATQSFNILFNL